jgi:hypothetical protein
MVFQYNRGRTEFLKPWYCLALQLFERNFSPKLWGDSQSSGNSDELSYLRQILTFESRVWATVQATDSGEDNSQQPSCCPDSRAANTEVRIEIEASSHARRKPNLVPQTVFFCRIANVHGNLTQEVLV